MWPSRTCAPCRTEETFQYPERMLHLGAHIRLTATLRVLQLVHAILVFCPAAGHILSPWGGLPDHPGLALIATVAPELPLFAVQRVSQYVAVGDGRRRCASRMRHVRLRVQADIRLQPEVPLLAFARLAYRRVMLFAHVLSR